VVIKSWVNRCRQWVNRLNNNRIVPTARVVFERRTIERRAFIINVISLHPMAL
jgi:hypothetical protein